MTALQPEASQPRPNRARRLLAVAGAAALVALVISCATTTRTVVVPPSIPGADYVGSKECEQCHEEIYKGFKTAAHARLQAKGKNALDMGCESCHGPGSLHVESGGERRIASHNLTLTASVASDRPTILNPRKSSETCFNCHLDKRGSFQLPSHHQVPEGRMSCGDCHDPHKGPATKGGGTALLSQNEACLKCHENQRGPYVFEHQAMREGCLSCHDPHGSVNAKLLTARNSNLCLKCHFQQVTTSQILIGGVDHKVRLQQGTCWTAGCHEAVHGSRVNPSLQF